VRYGTGTRQEPSCRSLLEKRDLVMWLLTGIALTATLFGIVVGSD
jgi:hypothetical protein